MQALADVFFFGKVVASSLGRSGSIELQVSTSPDDPGKDKQEWWGQSPGLICRPSADAEACGMDLGSERIVLGVKERRWQVSVEEGECVVRAIGPSPAAYIKLKLDGTAEVHATSIHLGGADLTGQVPLAAPIISLLNTLKTAISGAGVGTADGGALFKSNLMTALAAWPGTTTGIASTKVRAE
jgi:hypothetical protein